MGESSYNVRFWKTEVYQGKKRNTYYVRWVVEGEPFKEAFTSAALAESFRADLVSAARKGEAFDIEAGRPVSMSRADLSVSWFKHAVAFADMKWPRAAGTTRRTHAEALSKATLCLLKEGRGGPDGKMLRHVLNRWAFNPHKRTTAPEEVAKVLNWLGRNTRPVAAIADPVLLRKVLDGLSTRLDGTPGSPVSSARYRAIFSCALNYGVEAKLLRENPIPGLKWKPPMVNSEIDKGSVPNPVQVRVLLDAVREVQGGARLVAFYACLYYAFMRPEEVAGLTDSNLHLPQEGWGELRFQIAEPHAGKDWTDSGENRDRRQLKQRAVGTWRTAPCPPELTALLHWHIQTFGPGAGGRLFTGERNKNELPKGTINRVFRRARAIAFTPQVCATTLAATPYHFRHAGISLALAAGVPAADVAKWAGQSVEILYRIYAAWLAGNDQIWRNKIQEKLAGGA